MQTLLISFFPTKWAAGFLGFNFLSLLLLPTLADAIAVFCITLFFGLFALLAYYVAKHQELVEMVSQKLVLSFISTRPYKYESDRKREESWEQLAIEANEVVEQKYSVKNYFSAKNIEKLLSDQISSPPVFPLACRKIKEEVAGWESVLLVASNIRNEDITAYWNRRLPSGIMEQYTP